MGRQIALNRNVGIFVTMNEEEALRTELPENLRAQFRPMTMMVPDAPIIAQVLLQCQGFTESKSLGQRLVTLYQFMSDSLSDQKHYDFSLRAVIAVLRRAGDLLKQEMASNSESDRNANGDSNGNGDGVDGLKLNENADSKQSAVSMDNGLNTLDGGDGANDSNKEEVVMLRAINELNAGKLVESDRVLFDDLISDLFPVSESVNVSGHGITASFRQCIRSEIEKAGLQCTANVELKMIQIYQSLLSRHGNMIVGPSNGGKTTAWKMLKNVLDAMTKKDSK